ncbi:hypothetical protein NKG05_17980 [Oerskovia sp. M15]
MKVADQIALVTGANRGIGRQFVLELLERGASKVYATARRPRASTSTTTGWCRYDSTCSTTSRSCRLPRPRRT